MKTLGNARFELNADFFFFFLLNEIQAGCRLVIDVFFRNRTKELTRPVKASLSVTCNFSCIVCSDLWIAFVIHDRTFLRRNTEPVLTGGMNMILVCYEVPVPHWVNPQN